MHVFGAERIDGYAIKKQAEAFFQENGLDLTLSISDNRTFFPCPVPSPSNKDNNRIGIRSP